MREHRLGVAFAIVVAVCGWSAAAHAAVTATPSTITAPVTNINVQSTDSNATALTRNTSGNPSYTLTITGCSGGAGSFEIFVNGVSTNLAALNNPTSVVVRYTPTATGTRTCTVNVVHDQSATTEGTFTIVGSGQTPAVMSIGSISAFGSVREFNNAVTASSSTRNISVTNTGGGALNLMSVATSGDFTIESGATGVSSIPGGESRTWTIRFNPTAVGTRTGNITFASSNAGTQMVALTGEGTSGAFSTNMADTNFDTVAGGSTAALDVTLNHDGGAPKGTITIKSATVTPDDGTKAWFALSGVPGTVGGTGGTLAVTCSPPVGNTMTATAVVRVVVDEDGSPGPNYDTTYMHNVSCTGGASLLALSDATTDFGNHLVGSTSASQMFSISNTGNQPATVAFSSTSANRFYFQLSTPGQCGIGGNPACDVAAGATVNVMAQFSPNAEGNITAGYTIASSGVSLGFTLNGRGVDRHFELTETMYQVADTFRNPGSKATVTKIPLRNAGEYPILVSELAIEGEPTWTIANPVAPFMIGGLETVDLEVRFAPMVAGKADDAQIYVLNDDAKFMGGMPKIILSGNGKDRNVDMTPGAVDVGDTFAGIATRFSITRPDEALQIVNSEVTNGIENNFTIREIRVQDSEGNDVTTFSVINRATGEKLDGYALDAESSVEVDVVFTPTYPGDFEAFINVFLDEDTVPQTPIPVRGRALYVDAHGSGGFGCSTGHGSRGAMLLIIGAVALLLRRRHR